MISDRPVSTQESQSWGLSWGDWEEVLSPLELNAPGREAHTWKAGLTGWQGKSLKPICAKAKGLILFTMEANNFLRAGAS